MCIWYVENGMFFCYAIVYCVDELHYDLFAFICLSHCIMVEMSSFVILLLKMSIVVVIVLLKS